MLTTKLQDGQLLLTIVTMGSSKSNSRRRRCRTKTQPPPPLMDLEILLIRLQKVVCLLLLQENLLIPQAGSNQVMEMVLFKRKVSVHLKFANLKSWLCSKLNLQFLFPLKITFFSKLLISCERFEFIIFLPVESPRDASNKDSPASQADSGVFSIASSSSPSKGDAAPTTEGTSPDSPNRDRITYTDQAFNRDMNCKYYNILMSQLIWFSFNRLKLKHFA